jgi:translation initiation factor eIF-2B subunit alpha
MSEASRTRIAEVGHSFVQDGCTVLTHGFSRVVMALLLKAAAESKQFNVIVTEAGNQGEGCVTAHHIIHIFTHSYSLYFHLQCFTISSLL